MEVVSYQCPNCGAPLEFHSETQKWDCKFCLSSFEESDLEEYNRKQEQKQKEEQEEEEQYRAEKKCYFCPNCGAELITDEETVATFCTFCGNPSVLPKKLEGEFQPKALIPFKLDKANVFINGESSTVSTLKDAVESGGAVLLYYHPGSKSIWAYTEDSSDSRRGIVRGTVSNIYYTSVDVMSPSAVTLEESGDQYQLASSEMQFAFSMYGNVRVGDTVTLVYEKTVKEDGTETYTVLDYLED